MLLYHAFSYNSWECVSGSGCLQGWVGDGICDPECYNAICGFDNGDCEVTTTESVTTTTESGTTTTEVGTIQGNFVFYCNFLVKQDFVGKFMELCTS